MIIAFNYIRSEVRLIGFRGVYKRPYALDTLDKF
jgi:hypothetical protein